MMHTHVIQPGDHIWLLAQRYHTTADAILRANPGLNPDNFFVGQQIALPTQVETRQWESEQRTTAQISSTQSGFAQQQLAHPQPVPSYSPTHYTQSSFPQTSYPLSGFPFQHHGSGLQPPGRWRADHCISKAELDYRNDMRSLWEEHVAWTRMAITSIVFDLPDVEFVLARLLKNATDMGNMLRRLYGDKAAETYAQLIKEHLLIAADLVKAAKAGDQQAAQKAEKKWFQNADQIAEFLSSINRFLPREVVREMFYTHLRLTKQEAVTMINKQFEKDIEAYDKIEKQAREMADAISDAMVKQYPNMF